MVRAAIMVGAGEPLQHVDDLELDTPRGREVLVDVHASGICHSDVGASGLLPDAMMPLVLGHEVAGIVRAVGPQVQSLQPGDHVVGCEISHCGHCAECVSGRSYRCIRTAETERAEGEPTRASWRGQAVTAFSHLGGFAAQVLVHENNLVRVPAELPFDVAAILGCAVVTGAGAAINSAQVRVGDTAAVIGCGGVGLSVVQGAALAGARRVIAIDIQPAKLELARRFGATDVVDARSADAVEAVRSLTGDGVDHAFEVAGLSKTARQALEMARPTGAAYLIGVPDPAESLTLRLFDEVMMPKKSLRMVYMGSSNFQHDIPLYADLYLQGRFNLDDLIGDRIDIGDLDSGFENVLSGRVARTVITTFRPTQTEQTRFHKTQGEPA
jgi:S-(hydroxymethyl)glutathione dehydrogenase/alcohol dehydrogenase